MNHSDITTILNFHNQVIQEFGMGTIEALGWVSPASQRARFEVLAAQANYSGRSVLDVGCGHGDLRNYLSERYQGIKYTGVEQMPALLTVAIDRYGQLPDTQFLKGDFSEMPLPAADYVIACGALSYQTSDPDYIFQTIKKLFGVARMGFAFNFLTRLLHPDEAIAAYDPVAIKKYCLTLTTNVKCIDGYWENDCTMLLLR